jgi:hypothetical protein
MRHDQSDLVLVEAQALGIDSFGSDISEFNCLLSKVKTDRYDLDLLEHEINDALSKISGEGQGKLLETRGIYATSSYLTQWFAPQALEELLGYQAVIEDYHYKDVLKVILSRAARSARLTTHFDLDFPKQPQTESYSCYKHSRICPHYICQAVPQEVQPRHYKTNSRICYSSERGKSGDMLWGF